MKKLLLAATLAALVSVTPAFAADDHGHAAPHAADATAPAATTTTTTTTEVTTPAADATVAVTTTTIADVASANPELSTLVSALKSAEWVDTLKGPGPYTVFAPSNAAFAALPAGKLEELLKPENKEKLQNLLKHHVVDGKISASDIAEGATELKAANGTNLKVEKNAEGVKVGGAKVTQADVAASNGVVHIIDTVIVE